MMITKIIPLALAYIMFTLGLGLNYRDFSYIKHNLAAFAVGLFNQIILVPIVFLSVIWIIKPTPEIAFGLMLISFCPGGVTSNLFTRIINGNVALSIALTGVVSLISVLTLPILTAIAYRAFFYTTMPSVSIVGLGIKMFILTTIPVLIGMLLCQFFPQCIAKMQRLFANSATIIFILILIATIMLQREVLIHVFSSIGFILPLISAVLLGLSIIISRYCHLSTPDKYTIGIETSIQNGSVGMAVATLIAAGHALPEYALPSLLYGLLMNLIVLPFAWFGSKKPLQECSS